MKARELSTLVILASIAITTMTGCAKKSVPIVPYPSTNPAQAGTNTTQNIEPMQQAVQPNQAYYGNGATLTEDNGEFDNTGATAKTAGASAAAPADAEAPADTTTPATETPAEDPGAVGAVDGDIPAADTGDLDIGGIPDLPSYAPPGGANGGSNGYTLANTFKVDQDSYDPTGLVDKFLPSRNQWQAVGVAVSGSNIYVTAFDKSGVFKKGTVISMDSESGKNWKNIGSTLLGAKYPMDATVKGIAVDSSGNLFANDTNNFIYQLMQPKFSLQKVSAGLSDALDIASLNSSLIVATTTGLKKYESSAVSSGTDFATGLSVSGGIGSDGSGNLYVISGSVIKKIDASGNAKDFITDATGAIDVVATEAKKVCVLTADGIKMYDETGKFVSTFGAGDYTHATSIAASGKDLFIADTGNTYADSKVIKYSIMTL